MPLKLKNLFLIAKGFTIFKLFTRRLCQEYNKFAHLKIKKNLRHQSQTQFNQSHRLLRENFKIRKQG